MRFLGDSANGQLNEARKNGLYLFQGFTELDPDRMHLFKRMVEDVASRGVRIVGFTVPYAPTYWQLLNEDQLLAHLVERQHKFISAILEKHGFEYFDLLDPHYLNLQDSDFHDSIHPTVDGMRSVLRYIAHHSASEKVRFRLRSN